MSVTVRLPELSPNMERATIVRWLKSEGDSVAVGDILAEVETDKATMEMEAMDSGVLTKILVPEGTQDVAVNAPIALLITDDGRGDEVQSTAPDSEDPRMESGNGVEARTPRIAASPLARKLARESELDIGRVVGSGPRGRIIAADVRAMMPRGGSADAHSSGSASSSPERIEKEREQADDPKPLDSAAYVEVPINSVRRTIARSLKASKQEVPHFRVAVDVECDAALALRKTINDRSPDCYLTLNDFIVRAVACAMEQTPEANSIWAEDKLLRFKAVDIAVAIAAAESLYAPVIRNAARKTISTISAEMRQLSAQAQAGVFSSLDLRGGTTAVSNLGMFGIRSFDAIINPPQSSIFAVGRAQPRAIVREGALAVATVATITMSCDHRVIDGAVAAKAMERLNFFLEEPVLLMI